MISFLKNLKRKIKFKSLYSLILSFLVIFSLFGVFSFARADDFGVSPPYVKNDHLIPGSRFETVIYLVRSTPDQEVMVEASIDAPQIEDWIRIEKGSEFPLPKGVQQFPMKVIVDVPEDADLGHYQGYIRVRANASDDENGQVSLLSGARIDLDLKVGEEGFADFEVRGISIPDFEIGSPLNVLVKIENKGNVRTRPSRIHVDVYDLSHKKILKSVDVEETTWVGAFETKQVEGSAQVDLEIGEYWADVIIYKDGESLGITKVYFQVVEKKPEEEIGTAGGDKDNIFASFNPYLIIGTIIALILVIIILVFIKKRKKEEFDFREEDDDDDELFPFDKETQKTEKKKKGNKKRRIEIKKDSPED
jgi:hypothetical protein